MKKYPYEELLRNYAAELLQSIGENAITANLDEQSFREYHVKITVEGKSSAVYPVHIYYSPTKNNFSVSLYDVKDSELSEFLSRILPQKNESAKNVSKGTKNKAVSETPSGILLYVDGSYRLGITGYAYACIKNGKVLFAGKGIVPEIEVAGTRQIAGELRAVTVGLEHCIIEKITEVVICYDLQNTMKWATGAFKTNTEVTASFAAFMKKVPVKVSWHKIKAHTGEAFNEYVDRLANEAIDEYLQEK